MKILIVTDAWYPQVNGVVRTLDMTRRELVRRGHEVMVFEPSQFRTWPMPFYPEIRLARNAGVDGVIKLFEREAFEAIHIATEGPLGWAVRRACLRRRQGFSTSYHTNFPEYFQQYLGLPPWTTYWIMRRFHRPAIAVMVATERLRQQLLKRGFKNPLPLWSRGVDTEAFCPRPDLREPHPSGKPVALYVGRIAVEKNIEAFLKCDVNVHKRVVGDGPALRRLQQAYPHVEFLGPRHGEDLVAAYAGADVFVFPSLTDTFGLVMIEALACGVPVAAFPVPGPADVLADAPPEVACLHTDLATAVAEALARGQPAACREYSQRYSWAHCTEQFLENLAVPSEDFEPRGYDPTGSLIR